MKQPTKAVLPANNKGYLVLMTTLMVGLIITTLTISSLLQSSNATSNSLAQEHYLEAYNLAELCAEEALQQINDNNAYTGTSTISFSPGSCTYVVNNEGGEIRKIESEGLMSDSYSRVEITINALTPEISIANWLEVAEFTP